MFAGAERVERADVARVDNLGNKEVPGRPWDAGRKHIVEPRSDGLVIKMKWDEGIWDGVAKE